MSRKDKRKNKKKEKPAPKAVVFKREKEKWDKKLREIKRGWR